MLDSANDPVLQALRRVQLFNHDYDRVKVSLILVVVIDGELSVSNNIRMIIWLFE